MAEKTNAIRILEKSGIHFETREYEVDPDNLAADHVAEQLGEAIESVYKTLVLRGDKNGIFVCIIAADKEVDLKKAAKISGNKKAEMIGVKELQPLTGYIRGGCTAIGMKKKYPVYLSDLALNQNYIFVSAGKRGMQIKLKPEDLKTAAEAVVADITPTDIK